MKQEFYNLEITTNGQKLYEFTDSTLDWIKKFNLRNHQTNFARPRWPLGEFYA